MIKDKGLIRKISILERLPVLLLATIGTLFIICSLFAWIWFGFILSLKMFVIGYFAVVLGMKLENMIILYVSEKLDKEKNKPGIGKWESRIADYCDDISYESQKKANTEAVKKIIENICKN